MKTWRRLLRGLPRADAAHTKHLRIISVGYATYQVV
jgi:hypothetical protein